MRALAGIVSSHAIMILLATPHFTVLAPMVVPTPMIEVHMIWVVLTGIPPSDAPIMVVAPAVSAANRATGRSLVILYPMVLTIRHPPHNVPSAIEVWAARITQLGTGRHSDQRLPRNTRSNTEAGQ